MCLDLHMYFIGVFGFSDFPEANGIPAPNCYQYPKLDQSLLPLEATAISKSLSVVISPEVTASNRKRRKIRETKDYVILDKALNKSRGIPPHSDC